MNNIFDERYLEDMSNMRFISDNTYHIEQSKLYQGLEGNVKTVEFIRVKGDKLLLVEAKTTFPNPANSEESFSTQIDEICDKFIHSLQLYSSVKVGVNDEVFEEGFVPPEKISLIFILVIKSCESKWCRRVKNTIKNNLPKYINRIWKPVIYVINHEIAVKRELVVA